MNRNKIEKEIKDIEEQTGFRAGRSCMDSTFTLKQVVDNFVLSKLIGQGIQQIGLGNKFT